jgi:hypothetical protein
MKNQSRKLLGQVLALALGIVGTQSSPAQSFKKVKVALNAPIVQVASGGASVWALSSNGHPYILKGKSFALANNISLSQIAVGGGNSAQADEVWALNSSGSIFRAHKSGTSWVFSQVTGVLDGIMVGPGYQDTCHPYEVWGLNTGSEIFRYNFCGNNFEQEPGFLCDLHVGGGDIWGAQCGPKVFRFDFGTGVFDEVSDPFGAFPVLTVGPTGVWAIDPSIFSVYQYDDFLGFIRIACCSTFQVIQAGGDGVWALSGNNVYRLVHVASSFVQVPGSLVSISVGSGGGVWGINGSNQVFAFSTP